MKVSSLKQPLKGFKFLNGGMAPLQNTQTPFSLNKAKKQLRKARLQQNIIKIQALINDSLVKVNSLLGKADDRKQVLLLTQIASNLLKTQTKLEQLSRFIEKTLLEIPTAGISEGSF